MKKISIIILAALAMLFAGCKAENAVSPVSTVGTVSRSFSVCAPVTKTSIDGLSVNWTAADEINVIGVNASNVATGHTFTLKSGAGTSSAVFTGEVNEDETTFYAIYPNVDFDAAKFAAGNLVLKNTLPVRSAVKDGFDPACAVMMAKADASGSLSFVHCMAYIKLKVGEDDVDGITISSNGSARFNGKPSFTLASMANANVESASNTVSVSGPFDKDAIYYIPVTVKASSLKTLTIEYTFSDGTPKQSIATEKMKNDVMEVGKVYDFGCPPITKPTGPSLSLLKTSVTGVEPDAAVGLTIDSAYGIMNCTDADIAVTFDGTVVTAASVSGGTVTYSVAENTGSARNGWIGLQVPGGEVQKITVSQKQTSSVSLTAITAATSWGSSVWTAIKTAVGTDPLTADLIDSNLKFIDGGKGKIKFTNDYVQLGGSGSAGTATCIQFMAGGNGTLVINAKAAGTSGERPLVVCVGSTEVKRYTTTSSFTDYSYSVTASSGDLVNIFSASSGINIASITWTPAS
ncbi:MAG: hypothetical protein IJQ93_01740 [Bacteroidales bacterium]|nr:hypothetical protein [Bacteroidales bacterium]